MRIILSKKKALLIIGLRDFDLLKKECCHWN